MRNRLEPTRFLRTAAALAPLLAAGPGCGADDAATTIRVSLREHNPAVVAHLAFQDGDGAWALAGQPRPGEFAWTFAAASGRYSLAFQCREVLGEVIHATTAELSHVELPCADVPNTLHSLDGTLRGLRDSEKAEVVLGDQRTSQLAKVTRTPDRFELAAPPGTYDVVALAVELSGATRMLVKRNVTLPASGALDLDFTGARALNQRAAPPSGPGSPAALQVVYTTAGGLGVPLPPAAPGMIHALAGTDLAPGDRQELHATWIGVAQREMRGVSRLVDDDPLPPLDPPAPLESAELTWSPRGTGPVQRLRATFAPYPNATFYQLSGFFMDRGTTAQTLWVVNASARWLSGRTTFEMPDLTHLRPNPFDPILAPPQGATFLQGEIVAVTSTRGLRSVLDGHPPTSPADVTSYAKTIFLTAPPP